MAQFMSSYSMRRFTNSADKLNGFLGILRSMYATYGIQHFWGVPILPRKSGAPRSKAKATHPATPRRKISPAAFLAGLSWNLVYPAKRIDGLPSWSWVGWTGILCSGWGVSGISAYREDGSLRSDPDVEISFISEDGRNVSWDDFQDGYPEIKRVANLTPNIQITTWIAKATILEEAPNSKAYAECNAAIEAGQAQYIPWKFRPNTQSPLIIGQTYTCLYVGEYSDYPSCAVNVLIVKEVDSAHRCFERIGGGFLAGTPDLRFPNCALRQTECLEENARWYGYNLPNPLVWKERMTVKLI
jgi:hypothetical protein